MDSKVRIVKLYDKDKLIESFKNSVEQNRKTNDVNRKVK